MFKSPVKHNLQSPEGTRWLAVNYLECFTRTHHRAWLVSLNQCPISWKSLIFPTPLSFSAIAWGDPSNLWKSFADPETRVFHTGENLVILACTFFDWSTRVTDGRTDRWTNRQNWDG